MVVFGMYEKLIDSILNFFKAPKQNFKFLLPIAIGVGIGVILFGNILCLLFNNFENEMKFLFIGLIIGGIPGLLKTANSKKGFRLHYLFYSIITFSITILLISLESNNILNSFQSPSIFYLVLSGFIMSIGVVVPGVSSTVLLMILGIYNTYLLAVSTINLQILIPIGFGLLIGSYIFLNVIKYCLENFSSQTYYSIIGFVLGSTIILFPSIVLNLKLIIYVLLFVFGLIISNLLES